MTGTEYATDVSTIKKTNAELKRMVSATSERQHTDGGERCKQKEAMWNRLQALEHPTKRNNVPLKRLLVITELRSEDFS